MIFVFSYLAERGLHTLPANGMGWCLFRNRVSISIRPHVYRAYSIIFFKTQNTFEMYIFLRFILTVTEVPEPAGA